MPKENEIPTMFIELIDQADSGYVRDDTAGTPHEERITAPGAMFIPSTGKRAQPILDKEGNETGRYDYVPIRYIKGCSVIDVEEQRKMGFEPNRIPTEDAILIKKGQVFVKREGDTALFDYLAAVFYNVSAVGRSNRAKGMFRVVEVEKKTETLNELDFQRADAVKYVQSLLTKKGKGYEYNEDKIDNVLTIMGLHGGENYPDKINVITHAAKNDPVNFLRLVVKSDDIAVTEVLHALELNVIAFDGNTVMFVDEKKIITSLGEIAMSQTRKVSALAEKLRTPEFASDYQLMKTKTEVAQENNIKD